MRVVNVSSVEYLVLLMHDWAVVDTFYVGNELVALLQERCYAEERNSLLQARKLRPPNLVD